MAESAIPESTYVVTQMWMNALRTMEDAVNLPLVPTCLTVSSVPVILDTLVMDLTAQVRSLLDGLL